MKILLVEDDEMLRNVLKIQLETLCFLVDTSADGESGSYLGRTNEYDLIILDGILPKRHGRQVCEEIRRAGKPTPILLLSMQSEIENKVSALNTGADDYLTKPFSSEELTARVRALLRRPKQIVGEILQCQDITLNTKRQTVMHGTQEVKLTKKEFMLLEHLMRNKGTVVSRGELLEHVWDSNVNVFSNSLETHILSLRKKLETKPASKLIFTLSGRGYKIDDQKT